MERFAIHQCASRGVGTNRPVLLLGARSQRNLLPARGRAERLLHPAGWLDRPTPSRNGTMAESSDLELLAGSTWAD